MPMPKRSKKPSERGASKYASMDEVELSEHRPSRPLLPCPRSFSFLFGQIAHRSKIDFFYFKSPRTQNIRIKIIFDDDVEREEFLIA